MINKDYIHNSNILKKKNKQQSKKKYLLLLLSMIIFIFVTLISLKIHTIYTKEIKNRTTTKYNHIQNQENQIFQKPKERWKYIETLEHKNKNTKKIH